MGVVELLGGSGLGSSGLCSRDSRANCREIVENIESVGLAPGE